MAATLTARPRETSGKGAARTLRREGRVPAVVYGHGDETRSVSVDSLELEKLLAGISVDNTLISLEVEGAAPVRTLIREIQQHPIKPIVYHVDFYQVHAGETLHLEIPVRLVGSPVGVRDSGGVLQQVLHELHVECLPKDIPDTIEVDVADLQIGEAIHIRDINVPGVKVLNDEALTICSVVGASVAALPETPESEEGPIGGVETELVRDREADAKDVPFEHGSTQPE